MAIRRSLEQSMLIKPISVASVLKSVGVELQEKL